MNAFENRFVNRVLHKALWALLLPMCAVWNLAQVWTTQANELALMPSRVSTELPAQWQGLPLRPLALSDMERRFAQRFPGTVARMTDGERVLVLRTVRQPTRMLHPAADCYKGLGYQISAEKLETTAGQGLWRCFTAQRAGRQVRVCEQIEDATGQTFTDASAWYWAAVAGQSTGPWRATTVARAL
jgi:hypothetical protein